MLVQFHPETRNLADVARQVEELYEALYTLRKDIHVVWTEPGMDAGRQVIIDRMEQRWDRQVMSDEQWVDLMSYASVLVGNSSCGIIETPSIPLPSVNIGDRQKGRLMADSIIDVSHDRYHIKAGIEMALSPWWRNKCLNGHNPYGDRGAAQRIAEFLRTCALS